MKGSSALVCMLLLAACSASPDDGAIGEAESAVSDGNARAGQHRFDDALPHTNGRACGTCHVESDHRALTPQHVAELVAQDPGDPLFNAIDADDPGAPVLTFDHLKAGLVRVTIRIADNLDVIDADGNVITSADRTIWVWRGVPTIENVAYTAPYQYDGREPTLQSQANGALQRHSQITKAAPPEMIAQIASFERTVFSSPAAQEVADALADGETPPPLDLHFPPGSAEAAGQGVFMTACATCHGGPTTNVIGDKVVFDLFFPLRRADGTIYIAGFLPNGIAIPAGYRTDLASPHEGALGISAIATLGQLGALPNPSGLSLPRYRIRFYTDATRTQKLVDMPPAPPGIGPSLVVEPFTVDPGRAVVSGDPWDWEGFDVPQLRGVGRTAPYFHDNSAPDLPALIDEYSRLILPVAPPLNLPAIYPPEGPGLPPEALTPTQKAQLLAFLQQL